MTLNRLRWLQNIRWLSYAYCLISARQKLTKEPPLSNQSLLICRYCFTFYYHLSSPRPHHTCPTIGCGHHPQLWSCLGQRGRPCYDRGTWPPNSFDWRKSWRCPHCLELLLEFCCVAERPTAPSYRCQGILFTEIASLPFWPFPRTSYTQVQPLHSLDSLDSVLACAFFHRLLKLSW